MGKISVEAKKRYADKVNEYKGKIDSLLQQEKTLAAALTDIEFSPALKRLQLADLCFNLVSYYLLLNNLSVTLLGVKNEAYLNDARKGCYKALIYLEETVSSYIDAPFSEYEDRLAEIGDFTEDKRWALLQKGGFAIQSVEDSFGSNTKWKWSFVEIEARFATITKNLLDLKQINTGLDPRAQFYHERNAHLRLVKGSLQKAADRYREKYELSTLRADDFKLAISYLGALRRIHIILGESDESEVIKRKMDIWRTKMETDSKKLEQRGKKK